MAEITIPLGTKAVRPAVPAKEFGEIYLMDLAIRAHQIGPEDTIYAEYVPFDKASSDRLLTDRRELRLPFWEAVAAVPEAAAAFAAVADALPALIAYQEAKEAAALADKPTS